jgi:hypothetical protein
VYIRSALIAFELQQGCVTTSGQPSQKSRQTVHHGLWNTSFKLQATIIHPDILPDHPTWQCHLSLVTSLPVNLSLSRYSPRIICDTLKLESWSSHFYHFHPTLIDGTYCLSIQYGNPISCQSRHGPRICCHHVTVQESVMNALQSEFGHRPITLRPNK